MIEHRHSRRFHVASVTLILRYQGLPVAACKLRDISQLGLSIWTTSPLDFQSHTVLEVECLVQGEQPDDKTWIRQKAMLVYHNPDSAGLMFLQNPDQDQQLFETILDACGSDRDESRPADYNQINCLMS
jgi:hypothetical protein